MSRAKTVARRKKRKTEGPEKAKARQLRREKRHKREQVAAEAYREKLRTCPFRGVNIDYEETYTLRAINKSLISSVWMVNMGHNLYQLYCEHCEETWLHTNRHPTELG